MRPWVPFSAALAPLALVGGWTAGAALQRDGYDSVRDTISALAARGAEQPWVMTTGLVLVGGAHLATALGLEEARMPGRVILGIGGVATILVAVFAQPSGGHLPAAALSFGALAAWPAFSGVPTAKVGRVASAVLLVLVCWLGAELGRDEWVGLVERVAAGAQALWPLAVVVALRRARQAVGSRNAAVS